MRAGCFLLIVGLLLSMTELRAEEDEGEEIASSIAQAKPIGFRPFGYLEIQPQASIITPGTLTLRNALYEVPYSSSAAPGMPAFSVGIGTPIGFVGDFELTWQGNIGYRYKSGEFLVHDRDDGGNERRRHPLSLHWVPISSSVKVGYSIPGAPFLRPSLSLGGGVALLHQRGALPGITQTFWVPYATISPALTVGEPATARDWFNGFSFGTTYYQALDTAQVVQGLTLDLTLHIVL